MPKTERVTIKLPTNLESRLTRALAEARALAASRGREVDLDTELRFVAEAVQEALWWQSRALAEHALRATRALVIDLKQVPAKRTPSSDRSKPGDNESGSCPPHLAARLQTLAAHVRHTAESRDIDGTLATELEVLDRAVRLALETDSKVAAESALRLVRTFAKRLPAVRNAVPYLPQVGRVVTQEQPSILAPTDPSKRE